VHASNLFFSGRVREAYDLAHRIRPAVPLKDLADEISFLLWSVIALESGQGWAELETWADRCPGRRVRLGDRAAAGRAALALGGPRWRWAACGSRRDGSARTAGGWPKPSCSSSSTTPADC
jgi:hypothetical protein